MASHRASFIAHLLTLALAFTASSIRCAECGPTPYECAVYHMGRQEFAAATQDLDQVLKRTPCDLKALNLLGIALTGMGKIEQANRQFRKALKLNPRFCPALKNLATNELTLNRTAEAKSHLEQVLKYAPQDELAHISLAEIYFGEKQCGPALEHYERSRVRVVNNGGMILHYSQCSLENGRQQPAAAMLDLLSPTDAGSQFRAGEMLGHAGVYAEAAKHFGLARKLYPDPYIAGYNEILMRINGGDFPSAIRTATELFNQGYQRAELYNLISQAYLKNGQIQEAYDALRKAAQIDPGDENNYIELAAICENFANYDLGIEITDIGLHHVPNSYRLYLQRGAIKTMKAQLTEAERDFETAQKLAPQEPLPYVARCITWVMTGQIEKAVILLQERARLSPEDFYTQYWLGEALIRSAPEAGSAADRESIAALESSIRLDPDFEPAHFQLGKLLLRRGDIDRAVHELEKAMALDPTDQGPVLQLARVYQRKGDAARAKELTAQAIKLRGRAMEDSDRQALKRIVRTVVPGSSTNPTSQ